MKKITSIMAGVALTASLLVAAPATLAPVESASAASCTTKYMTYFYPNYYRITFKGTGSRKYFNTQYKALTYLKNNRQAGTVHKLVGTMTSAGCVDHWQWKATVNYWVNV